MKKKTNKKPNFNKIKFIFDEYYMEVGLGKSQEMYFMGLPIKFSISGKTVTVDMHRWLVELNERHREHYSKK